MKRAYHLIAVLIIAASCNEITPPTATVCINIGGVRSGAITKSIDEVGAALAATAPSATPTLTLQSTEVALRKYTATPGESVTVPVGEYRVTASYQPAVVGDASGNNIYKTPSYKVDETIIVTEGADEYTVTASYDCFALVIDYDECEAYRHNQYQQMVDFAFFTKTGTVGVAYIGLEYLWGSINYRLIVVPKDKVEHEETEYHIVATDGYSGVKVEAGKWYSFSPNGVTTTSGSIGISTPEWVRGN